MLQILCVYVYLKSKQQSNRVQFKERNKKRGKEKACASAFQGRACLRDSTRPATGAVEAVDLGRRRGERDARMRETNEEPLLRRRFFLSLSLSFSLLRVLDAGEFRLVSALILSSRSCVVPSCFRRASVLQPRIFARAERSEDEKSSAAGGAQFFFLHLSFLLSSLLLWTTQLRSPPFPSFSPLAPFSPFAFLSFLSR